MERRVMLREFLEEPELRLLAAQFHVNILAANGPSKRFQPTGLEALRITLPPACVPRVAFKHTVAIYTSGGHFEALRDHDGYTFNERKVAEIIRRSENAANASRGAPNSNLEAAIAASLASPRRALGGRNNNNLQKAIAASLKNSAKKSAKKPALNYKAIANSIGVTVDELKMMYTNANLNAMFGGGGKRRTRRRRA